MGKHIAPAEAKRLLESAGYNIFEQRGFYSHFLRVRVPDATYYRTVACIDIEHSRIKRNRIASLCMRAKEETAT